MVQTASIHPKPPADLYGKTRLAPLFDWLNKTGSSEHTEFTGTAGLKSRNGRIFVIPGWQTVNRVLLASRGASVLFHRFTKVILVKSKSNQRFQADLEACPAVVRDSEHNQEAVKVPGMFWVTHENPKTEHERNLHMPVQSLGAQDGHTNPMFRRSEAISESHVPVTGWD